MVKGIPRLSACGGSLGMAGQNAWNDSKGEEFFFNFWPIGGLLGMAVFTNFCSQILACLRENSRRLRAAVSF